MNAIEWTFQLRFAVALALGFLVGLERESAKEHQKVVFGGVRTHPIISMLGFACAWLFQIGVSFMLPAGLLALSALAVMTYLAKVRHEHFGTTSEISALLTFVTGALALLVDIWIAMALGIVNAILLSEKSRLESFVDNLNRAEFLATLKFLLVTLIILPVLPDQDYTRFRLNPSVIWKFVIIVSSVGFVGYVLTRRLGTRVGLWLTGLLGGIVSSTALTVAMGRMARTDPARTQAGLQAALLAGAVMYVRILVILALISPAFAALLWWKLILLSAIGGAVAMSVRPSEPGRRADELSSLQNPFEIVPALLFAALFVALSILTGLVRQSAGDAGILTLSAVVGVLDIDPFILSLVQGPELNSTVAAGAIVLAAMSNTVAKGVYYSVLSPVSRKETMARYALWGALHIPVFFIS